MEQNQTLGESRVRVSFNVSNLDTVTDIKQLTAKLIDTVNELQVSEGKSNGEFLRLKSLAMTAYEEATMWAVKAITL